ncbi:MAG: 5-oxoprolinase subunit PxpB [Gemmatimonadales bacterium]
MAPSAGAQYRFAMRFTPLGDQAVTVTFGTTIDEATHRRVRAAAARLDAARVGGIVDLAPAFASIAVHYDPMRVAAGPGSPYERIVSTLERVLTDLRADALPTPREVEIPVCYGNELGPDLEDVAKRHGLTPDDVVRLHSGASYLVYMVGFMPGFAYLGGLPEAIATPRRSTPRTSVPAGAVGIGGRQTGVYPLVSPGGWNLIGRTPVAVFDIAREPATLVATGDRVRFRAISPTEFSDWRA